jgi:GNAT superfamily N-acetyltransferase
MMQDLAQRCVQALPALSRRTSQAADHAVGASVEEIDGVRVTVLGVPHPWGTQADLTAGVPSAARLDRVVDWLERTHGHCWTVLVRERHVGDALLRRAGLEPWSSEPVFAVDSAIAARFEPAPPAGVTVEVTTDRSAFVSAYGGWMDDRALAETLVSPSDVGGPGFVHLLASARAAARPPTDVGAADAVHIGSALVREAAGTGYLSAIGVVPSWRGRGIGAALTRSAAREAANGTDIVWMHASSEGAPMYTKLGFDLVDVHVLMAPRAALRTA